MTILVLLALAAGPALKVESGGGPLPKGAIARLGTDALRGHLGFYALLSPNAREFVFPGMRGVQVHDVLTGRLLRTVLPPRDVSSPVGLGAYCLDGRCVAIEDENHLVVLNVAAGAVIARLNVEPHGRAWGWPALSKNGDVAAILTRHMGELKVAVFDVRRGKELRAFPVPRNTSRAALSP